MNRARVHRICRTVFTVTWLGMVALLAVAMTAGGTSEKIEGSRHYVSDHGVVKEVSETVYRLVWWCEIGFIACCPVLLLAWLGWSATSKQRSWQECREEDSDRPAGPPAGTWFEKTGDAFKIGATMRDVALGLCMVPLIVLLFISPWGRFMATVLSGQSYARPGETAGWELLLAIPLLLVTLVFVYVASALLLGKTTISVKGDAGTYFIGVGPLGWRRTFNWAKVVEIRETSDRWRPGSFLIELVFAEGKSCTIARSLSDRRRHFVLATLNEMLAAR